MSVCLSAIVFLALQKWGQAGTNVKVWATTSGVYKVIHTTFTKQGNCKWHWQILTPVHNCATHCGTTRLLLLKQNLVNLELTDALTLQRRLSPGQSGGQPQFWGMALSCPP